MKTALTNSYIKVPKRESSIILDLKNKTPKHFLKFAILKMEIKSFKSKSQKSKLILFKLLKYYDRH